MTEFERAVQGLANETKPGTYVHLFLTKKGKMSASYNKTKAQNDEARFFCTNVVPMSGSNNIALQVSISWDGIVEQLFPPKK